MYCGNLHVRICGQTSLDIIVAQEFYNTNSECQRVQVYLPKTCSNSVNQNKRKAMSKRKVVFTVSAYGSIPRVLFGLLVLFVPSNENIANTKYSGLIGKNHSKQRQ